MPEVVRESDAGVGIGPGSSGGAREAFEGTPAGVAWEEPRGVVCFDPVERRTSFEERSPPRAPVVAGVGSLLERRPRGVVSSGERDLGRHK